MKDGDYINILAPMKSKLKLKGNALMLFALIHGYSKDGKNTCRVSLSYMAEWLDTDKSAVSKLINKLTKAGYINKLEYYSGGVKCFEYTANYEAMLVRSIRGEEMGLESPSVKGGCQNDNGCQNDQKGLSKRPKRVVKMTTNNKYIIIYNNFFMAEPTQPEEEKKIFSKLFFLKKAADPAGEAERFISYNQALGWRSKDGKTAYDTFEQKVGLAGLWKFEGGMAEGVQLKYAEAIGSLVDDAVKQNLEDVEVVVNPKHGIRWNRQENRWYWTITPEAHEWIYRSSAHGDLVHRHLDPIFNNIPVTFTKIN